MASAVIVLNFYSIRYMYKRIGAVSLAKNEPKHFLIWLIYWRKTKIFMAYVASVFFSIVGLSYLYLAAETLSIINNIWNSGIPLGNIWLPDTLEALTLLFLVSLNFALGIFLFAKANFAAVALKRLL